MCEWKTVIVRAEGFQTPIEWICPLAAASTAHCKSPVGVVVASPLEVGILCTLKRFWLGQATIFSEFYPLKRDQANVQCHSRRVYSCRCSFVDPANSKRHVGHRPTPCEANPSNRDRRNNLYHGVVWSSSDFWKRNTEQDIGHGIGSKAKTGNSVAVTSCLSSRYSYALANLSVTWRQTDLSPSGQQLQEERR